MLIHIHINIYHLIFLTFLFCFIMYLKKYKILNDSGLDSFVNKISNQEDVDIIFISNEDEDENENEFIHSKYVVPLNNSDKFIKLLRKNSETDKPLYLIIHCLGGDIVESDFIINAILRHNNRIYTLIPYYAASSATLIALTGATIYMDSYSYVTPADPQLSVKYKNTNKYFSSRVLMKFKNFIQETATKTIYNFDIHSYNSEYVLDAIDAKIYHDDNIETLKKILNTKRLSKAKYNKIIDVFGSGDLPHHHPLGSDDLTNMGLNVESFIPDELVEICQFYSKKL
jgi:hypothetical protein